MFACKADADRQVSVCPIKKSIHSLPQSSALMLFRKAVTVNTIRSDVSAFSKHCERLLSERIYPPLTDDERKLIAYYIDEMTRRYKGDTSLKPNGDTVPPL